MTKQEIARELEALGVTLTASQIKKTSLADLDAMLTKTKKPSNVVVMPTAKKVRALEDLGRVVSDQLCPVLNGETDQMIIDEIRRLFAVLAPDRVLPVIHQGDNVFKFHGHLVLNLDKLAPQTVVEAGASIVI